MLHTGGVLSDPHRVLHQAKITKPVVRFRGPVQALRNLAPVHTPVIFLPVRREHRPLREGAGSRRYAS